MSRRTLSAASIAASFKARGSRASSRTRAAAAAPAEPPKKKQVAVPADVVRGAFLSPLLLTALRYRFAALPAVFFIRRPQVDWRVLVGYGLAIVEEVVARAIALSQYLPYDSKRASFPPIASLFLPVNVAALSQSLIESELLKHPWKG